MERAIKTCYFLVILLTIFCVFCARSCVQKNAEIKTLKKEISAYEGIIESERAARRIDEATQRAAHDRVEAFREATEGDRVACDSVDARLDERLRELATEAYRAAVLCGTADDPTMRPAAGAGKP